MWWMPRSPPLLDTAAGVAFRLGEPDPGAAVDDAVIAVIVRRLLIRGDPEGAREKADAVALSGGICILLLSKCTVLGNKNTGAAIAPFQTSLQDLR